MQKKIFAQERSELCLLSTKAAQGAAIPPVALTRCNLKLHLSPLNSEISLTVVHFSTRSDLPHQNDYLFSGQHRTSHLPTKNFLPVTHPCRSVEQLRLSTVGRGGFKLTMATRKCLRPNAGTKSTPPVQNVHHGVRNALHLEQERGSTLRKEIWSPKEGWRAPNICVTVGGTRRE